MLVEHGVSERCVDHDAAHDVALANRAQRLPSIPEVVAAQEKLLVRQEVNEVCHLQHVARAHRALGKSDDVVARADVCG